MYIVRGLRILGGMCFCVVCIYFSLKSCLYYGVALLCVCLVLFCQESQWARWALLRQGTTTANLWCCFFDGVSATDCFFVDVRFCSVFFVTSNILSDAMFVSMVIYRQSVRETLSSGLRFSVGLGVNTGSFRWPNWWIGIPSSVSTTIFLFFVGGRARI